VITLLLLIFYTIIIVAYVAILLKMRTLFKDAFPDDYKAIRFRFFLIFVTYEAFLVFRATIYYYILLSDEEYIRRIESTTFYTSEILLVGFLSFMSLKSNQDDKNIDFENQNLDITNVRNSIIRYDHDN